MGSDEENDWEAECGHVMILPERMDFPTQELPAWFCWLQAGGVEDWEAEECLSQSSGGEDQGNWHQESKARAAEFTCLKKQVNTLQTVTLTASTRVYCWTYNVTNFNLIYITRIYLYL